MNEEQELQDVLQQLALLDPTAVDKPSPTAEAFTQLQARLDAHAAPQPSWLTRTTTNLKWRIQTMFQKQYAPRWAMLGVIVALFIAVFSMPAARALASDFLGLFRVQKFAAISIDPAQLDRLQDLDMEGLFPGELTMLAEPTEPTAVDNLEQAASNTGYTPQTIPSLGTPDSIMVSSGGAGILTIDLENARTILEIAEIDPALLPDSLDGQEISVTTYPSVMQDWGNEVHFMQSPAPEVAYPAGFDPAPIGQALLQFVGLSEMEAFALSQSIDWTSTLIVPVPSTMATFTEVSINGQPGLLLRAIDGPELALMWQTDGSLYFLTSNTLTDDALLDAAESVQ